ncbi:N(6)-L-threonylcarbamoyladenine synthase Kae1 [Candidatus Pacearchaeota archaeon]|nr:N(6)-L-threonylcarbamoyladenine synthase Kae1 [Candidatus Pacearchaeota archaeon]
MATGLGLECTSHTLGVGIIRNGKILANEKDSYTTEHGGIIPMEAAKHHERVFNEVLNKALEKSKIKLEQLDFISISNAPGLAPCLVVGMKKAKELSRKLNKPLVPVNHCISHLEIGRITGAKDPVMLYASGANTQIIAYAGGKYRIFGETLDIGIGNFLDNFARYLGIGFPGGPKVEKLALKSKNYIELPYKVKGMDIALSGILTNLKQKVESKNFKKEDLAYSTQETVFAMLVEVSERAMAHIGKKELLLGGGVGCNKRLQEMCRIMCKERNAKFFVPENSLLVDNGGMIAFTGELMFKAGVKYLPRDLSKVDIKPRQRTDEVEVTWR